MMYVIILTAIRCKYLSYLSLTEKSNMVNWMELPSLLAITHQH